jgi:hypothetical protein
MGRTENCSVLNWPTVTSTLQEVTTATSTHPISRLWQATGKALPKRAAELQCNPQDTREWSQTYSQTVSTVHTTAGYFSLIYCQGSHRVKPERSQRQAHCWLALTPRWILGPKRKQVTGGRRKSCNEKLCSFYCWRHINRELRTRTKCDRREINTRFWWGNLKESGHLEALGVDGRIILTWILNIQDGSA